MEIDLQHKTEEGTVFVTALSFVDMLLIYAEHLRSSGLQGDADIIEGLARAISLWERQTLRESSLDSE